MDAELAQRYRSAGYWRGETLGALLGTWAQRYGDAVALVDGSRRWSYVELDQLADRVACGLLDRGLRPGDRVVLHLPNIAEFVVAAFALVRIGALPVFALPDHREYELDHFIGFSEAVGLVVPTSFRGFDEQGLARKLRASHRSLEHVLVVGHDVADDLTPFSEVVDATVDARVDAAKARARIAEHAPRPDDVAFFLLSGGTTGLPKLIPRTHDDYAYNVRASAELCGFDRTTVYLVALPVAHNFPWGCPGLLGTLHAGGRAVLTQSPNPDASFPLIAAERVTATALVPALAIRWADAAASAPHDDLSSLRLLQVGGARLNPEAARRVRARLDSTLQQVFGMAEGLLNFTRLDDPEDVVIETQGRPLSPADEVRLVDDDGKPVPPGEAGRLETRGPYTIRGYHNAPRENAEAFTEDGFYRSGDVVRWHPSGNLSVEGRVKDFINRGGEKISAEEIENFVLGHPAVVNVAVVAMPDPELNERICAYVVLRPGAHLTLDQLRGFLQDRGLARFKRPDRLEILDELPLTNIGKVSKATLREHITRKLAGEAAHQGGEP